MMKNKIDPELLSKISILDNKNKLKCLIWYNNLRDLRNLKLNNPTYFPFIKAVAVDANTNDIFNIASISSVDYISSNSKVFTQVNVAKKIIGIEKQDTSSSSNFSCAVIDTGLFPHLDFMLKKNNIIAFKDFVNHKNEIYDDNGHGTVVSGILSGSGIVSDKKYEGIDSNLKLVVIKTLNAEGEAGAINILEAMQWILNNKEKYNIRIVCMSFGSTVLERNDPLIAGAEVLWDNGIIVVSACGNSGPDSGTIKSPSASTKIISVGALDDGRDGDLFNEKNFNVASFSSRGPILNNYKPDLVVSGVEINSCCNFGLFKKFYSKTSGTSVATPIVAGVCSLILRKNGNLTPNQVKQILIHNCIPITGDRNSEGYGWLNLKKFFNNN